MLLPPKAQVSVFLLLGVSVLLLGIFFYVASIVTEDEDRIESNLFQEETSIKSYVESCIESVGEDAIQFVSRRGGYFELPNSQHNSVKVAYYADHYLNTMPSQEKIEHEIAAYADTMLFFCLRNFADFKEQGLQIEQGEIKTQTTILKEQINFLVRLPLIVKKGEMSLSLSEFRADVDEIRFLTVYDTASYIVDGLVSNPNDLCISCILDNAIQKDLFIDIASYGQSDILFTIEDKNSMLNQESLVFMFAVKQTEFSCNNLPMEGNIEYLQYCLDQEIKSKGYNFTVADVPNLEATIGDLFYYQVAATGLELNFTDFTYLFNIDEKTGEIIFIPLPEHAGNHSIWISVEDKLKNQKEQQFYLIVQ